MRKRIISASALGLATVLAISTPVFAQDDTCGICNSSKNVVVISEVVISGYDNLNPWEHGYEVEKEYFCTVCGDFWTDIVYETEGHTYTLDPGTKLMTCDYCGDSYYHN